MRRKLSKSNVSSPRTPASACQYRGLLMSTADVTNLSKFQKLYAY